MSSRINLCMVCKGPLGYEPDYCCNDLFCGCRGLPTEPPICSEECYSKWQNATDEQRKEFLNPETYQK